MIIIKNLIIAILTLLSFIFVVSGCSSEGEAEYAGEPLTIAVVGTEPSYDFDNIQFSKVNIDDLFEEKGRYDALFVMEEMFLETSKSKYAELYKVLPYPTFFIGLNQAYEAFIDDELTILDFEESDSIAFAQGYFKHEQSEEFWTFVPPNPLKSENDYRSIYISIFNTIDEFLY
ncbi:hypothetical protein [Desertibacillus haloalkaliphilus]|uniref:hypothetical protein n=1 Tax=Desertibacillus haloalkaliphilus TaxID=1328930 RepID=UPI001C264F3D|nr:hypothetical protein [Desertibacillus haloalkaliphilus]MBU8906269.1 hypothetical protein [Desertibacillus haloalkaliphilus]